MTINSELINSDFDLFLEEYLAGALAGLAFVQENVSSGVENCIVDNPGPEQIVTYGHALIAEVSEWMTETGWKPWKPGHKMDIDKVTDEWADILAFIGILVRYMMHRGITPEQLAKAYRRKTMINIERIAGRVEGYEGNKGY